MSSVGNLRGVKTSVLPALVLTLLALSPLAGRAQTTESKPTVAALAWLTGTWTLERNGRVTVERWAAPAGGVMIGTSHTYLGERTIEYEFILIRANAQGEVHYVAKPSGQPEASFKLTRASTTEAVFENPQHDFPQKISYVLKGDGSLVAAIEGTKGGKARRVEFPYRPAK